MVKAYVKTVSNAYGMALLGLVLFGILSLHRFYLRRYLSATLQFTIMFVGFIVLLYGFSLNQEYENAVALNSLSKLAILGFALNQDFLSAIALGSMSPSAADIAFLSTGKDLLELGFSIQCIGLFWWLVDLFLIPEMVRNFNEEYGEEKA